MELLNQVRGHFFLLGILRNQQTDPYCGSCSAFANTLQKVQENLAHLAAAHGEELQGIAPQFLPLLSETRSGLIGLQPPADPSGQKKAGKCRLPEGTCFIKGSVALYQKI